MGAIRKSRGTMPWLTLSQGAVALIVCCCAYQYFSQSIGSHEPKLTLPQDQIATTQGELASREKPSFFPALTQGSQGKPSSIPERVQHISVEKTVEIARAKTSEIESYVALDKTQREMIEKMYQVRAARSLLYAGAYSDELMQLASNEERVPENLVEALNREQMQLLQAAIRDVYSNQVHAWMHKLSSHIQLRDYNRKPFRDAMADFAGRYQESLRSTIATVRGQLAQGQMIDLERIRAQMKEFELTNINQLEMDLFSYLSPPEIYQVTDYIKRNPGLGLPLVAPRL